MKIIVTGGTGFVGRALVDFLLARGDEVSVLTRDPGAAAARRSPGGLSFKRWDPLAAHAPPGLLDDAEAVVHLAGEGAVGRRLTPSLEEKIRESRLASTSLLVTAMQEAEAKPRVFVSCSAVGYYGARSPDEELDESAGAGDDFLAQLCVDWEARSRAAPAPVRVVNPRLGIVFGKDGGALEAMARPFKLFVGGPLGDGRQVVSWVHIDDVARALATCIDDESLAGPVNVTAPQPVDNRTLSQILGRVLHRPALLPTPGAALKLLFGRGAEPLLTGQRVVPKKLLGAGFVFRFSQAEDAVRQALES